ncbi:MAG: hypothetical protein ACREJM_11600 [Candidatus Saccharimonadales bacterium]
MATTLLNLRDLLADALGFSSLEANDAPMRFNLNQFLSRAQSYLYWNYGWQALRNVYAITPTIIGTAVYAWPAAPAPGLEPRKIVNAGLITAAGAASVLREGIPPSLLFGTTTNAPPTRYARGPQLTLWPPPDLATYTIKFDGYQLLAAFAVDTDVATLDQDIIMELAIGLAKLHYKQMDGSAAIQLMNSLITRLNESDEVTGSAALFTSPQQIQGITASEPREG